MPSSFGQVASVDLGGIQIKLWKFQLDVSADFTTAVLAWTETNPLKFYSILGLLALWVFYGRRRRLEKGRQKRLYAQARGRVGTYTPGGSGSSGPS